MSDKIDYILTDIEGTTTSISYVYDILFPYFRERIWELEKMTENKIVQSAFEQTKLIVSEEEGTNLESLVYSESYMY